MVDLRSDCKNCAALCCVALAFDRGDMFGFGKAAGQPCPELQPDFRCGIHKNLSEAGFAGCVLYECHGAGQRVVQQVFAGQDWRSNPELLASSLEAFAQMRQVHELILLLQTAEGLLLSEAQKQKVAQLKARLEPNAGWSRETLRSFERGRLVREVHQFLRGLTDAASKMKS